MVVNTLIFFGVALLYFALGFKDISENNKICCFQITGKTDNNFEDTLSFVQHPATYQKYPGTSQLHLAVLGKISFSIHLLRLSTYTIVDKSKQ